jgi:hypothetical protein
MHFQSVLLALGLLLAPSIFVAASPWEPKPESVAKCQLYKATAADEKKLGFHWGGLVYQMADPTTLPSKAYSLQADIKYAHQRVKLMMIWGHFGLNPESYVQFSANPVDYTQKVFPTQFKFIVFLKDSEENYSYTVHNHAACALEANEVPFNVNFVSMIVVQEMILNGVP